MNIQFIKNAINKKDSSVKEKIDLLIEYYSYYKKLKNSLKNGTIFFQLEKQNESLSNLMKKIKDDDLVLIEKLFTEDVKDFLKKMKLKNSLEFKEKDDFIQIGENFVLVKEPIEGLWTTGKASIYMPMKLNENNRFRIDLFSIPPLKFEIYFEGKIVKKESIDMLSSKTVDFTIKKSDVIDKIAKLSIKTNKFWLPNLIIERDEKIPIGIGLKSITNFSY